ncbi:hypothetical protein A6S26_17095 [Nostoc sp. ATCC 43529]|nr:hypothetical protein A6S26_17095 [Nostoc sp. ATCC 43529]
MDKYLAREIAVETDIYASADRVWKILTDFNQFPNWNPFIKKVEGDLREGCKLKLSVELPSGKTAIFQPILTKVVEKSNLIWLSRFIIPGLFDGEHIFEIKSKGNNIVSFVQRERYSGLFVPLFWKNLEATALESFRIMNQGLKERAEIGRDII